MGYAIGIVAIAALAILFRGVLFYLVGVAGFIFLVLAALSFFLR